MQGQAVQFKTETEEPQTQQGGIEVQPSSLQTKSPARSSDKLMDHFLLGDEMGSLVEEIHEGIDVEGPIVENVIGVLRALERDHALQAVDTGFDGLVDDQVGQEFFGVL